MSVQRLKITTYSPAIPGAISRIKLVGQSVTGPTGATGAAGAAGADGTAATAAHIADTTDAHDASAISVLDAGGYYTGSDVETALAEVFTRTRTILKAADQTVNNSSVRINDTSLSFAIGANEVWAGRIVLFVTGSTAADFKYAIAGPFGCTVIHAGQASRTTDALITATEIVTTSDVPVTNVGVNAAGGIIDAAFVVAADTTAGTVSLNWAQGVATLADTTVKKHSYMSIQRVA